MSFSNKRPFSEVTSQQQQDEIERKNKNNNNNNNDINEGIPENKRRKIDPNLLSTQQLTNNNKNNNNNNDNNNKDDNINNNNNDKDNTNTTTNENENENENDNENNKIDNVKKNDETNTNTNTNTITNNPFGYNFQHFGGSSFGFDEYITNNKNDKGDNSNDKEKDKDNNNDNKNNDNTDKENKNSKLNEPFTAEWGNSANSENATLSWDFNWKSTITSDFDFGLSWGSKDNKKKNNNDDEDDNNEENNEDIYNNNNFTSQQPIAVLKGEELDSGDQQDNVLCSTKAKIYKLEKVYNNNEDGANDNNDNNKDKEKENDKNNWSSKYCEKGVGTIKVTTYYNNENQKKYARIICRRDEIHTLIMNLPLLKGTKFKNKESKIIITSVDPNNTTNPNQSVTFLIKPLESSESNNLTNAIQNAIQQIS